MIRSHVFFTSPSLEMIICGPANTKGVYSLTSRRVAYPKYTRRLKRGCVAVAHGLLLMKRFPLQIPTSKGWAISTYLILLSTLILLKSSRVESSYVESEGIQVKSSRIESSPKSG